MHGVRTRTYRRIFKTEVCLASLYSWNVRMGLVLCPFIIFHIMLTDTESFV